LRYLLTLTIEFPTWDFGCLLAKPFGATPSAWVSLATHLLGNGYDIRSAIDVKIYAFEDEHSSNSSLGV
jgi:hypothetical protein